MEKFEQEPVLEFIQRRFPVEGNGNWTTGNCYYFAVILKSRFPDATIFYDVVDGHFVTRIEDSYWDYTGEIFPESDNLVPWEKFQEYDYLQFLQIIHDCLY